MHAISATARALSKAQKLPLGRAWASTCTSTPSPSKVIFSGIQPTGVPHLGNYLGALKNWVSIQNASAPTDQIFYSVVGLHAVTLPQDPKKLKEERRDMMATFLAIGLDPDKCCLFHQDQVPEHAELAWLLNCITSVGRLERMTTWKSRLADTRAGGATPTIEDSTLHLGLLAYPVLQAADVLLYKTTHIPVGEDQEQHIELTRDIARLFNKQFSPVFRIPRHVFAPQARVLNLRDPTSKMSKSNRNPSTRILLTDSPSEIASKLKSAVTDSTPLITYDPSLRPGISNLLSIYAGFTDSTPEEVARQFEGKMASELKNGLTEVVGEGLKSFRAEFARLRGEQEYLKQIEEKGRDRARRTASETLGQVKMAMGLL